MSYTGITLIVEDGTSEYNILKYINKIQKTAADEEIQKQKDEYQKKIDEENSKEKIKASVSTAISTVGQFGLILLMSPEPTCTTKVIGSVLFIGAAIANFCILWFW